MFDVYVVSVVMLSVFAVGLLISPDPEPRTIRFGGAAILLTSLFWLPWILSLAEANWKAAFPPAPAAEVERK